VALLDSMYQSPVIVVTNKLGFCMCLHPNRRSETDHIFIQLLLYTMAILADGNKLNEELQSSVTCTCVTVSAC